MPYNENEPVHVVLFLLLLALPPLAVMAATRPLAFTLSGLVVGSGLAAGMVAPLGLVWLALLFLAAGWLARATRPASARPFPRRIPALIPGLLLSGLGVALAFGLAPGFSPLVLWEPEVLKPDSAPFGLRLRIEKVLLGVAVLAWFVTPIAARGMGQALLRALPVALATLVVVGLLALALDYVRFAPVLPPLSVVLAWAAVNLLIVCVIEEGFFRGVVQARLAQRWPAPAAIGVAALLFGLAHIAGGWSYVLLAALAGAGYGLAYHVAGRRLEAAVLAHFLLNAGHFALFTYPFAVQAG